MEEELERKFGSEGATLFSKAEEIFCAAGKGNALEGKISEVVKTLGNDLREDKLHHELCVMGNLSGISDAKTFEEIRQYFQLNKTSREHMPEVTKLMRIILCAAFSTATSERSSMLKRLKTWLRTSMSQPRLTWLGVLILSRGPCRFSMRERPRFGKIQLSRMPRSWSLLLPRGVASDKRFENDEKIEELPETDSRTGRGH